MPKNFFEDMVKVKRASMESMERKEKKATPVHTPTSTVNTRPVKKSIPKVEIDTSSISVDEKNADFYASKHSMWLLAIGTVIFFLFALSFLFSKAIITINPYKKDIVLNENFSASKSNAPESLSFDLVVMSGEEKEILTSTEKKDVSESARGVVIIYNDYSAANQSLDINTRLEGTNGKIYKTEKKVVVPGRKGTVPGAVEVGIYASVPGETYNSSPLDFKVVGFKGSPKYEKFYARSKGDIKGGLVGNVSIVSEEAKAKALVSLKEKLQAKLSDKVKNQIPEGFTLFKNSVFLSVNEEKVDVTSSTSEVPVTVSGTLYGFLFKESELTNAIIKNTGGEYGENEVYIPHLEDLSFSIDKVLSNYKDIENINFNLSGNMQIVSKIDEDKLLEDMLGKKRKQFNIVLSEYKEIDSANLVLKPIWKRTIPDVAKKVKLIINYPE